MKQKDAQFLRDIGFITAMAENWADMMISVREIIVTKDSNDTFAQDAEQFRSDILKANDRLRAYARGIDTN